MFSSAIGLTYWLKMSASEIVKLNTLKPLARSEYGKISSVYDTMSGVNARLAGHGQYAARKRWRNENETHS